MTTDAAADDVHHAPAGTVSMSMSATAKAFDPAITAASG
jgi:hypothetical protein